MKKKKKVPVVETEAPVVPVENVESVEAVEPVAPVENAEPVETAAPVEEKKGIVNCPKCGTALHVKVSNVAYLCPVCSQMFRTRLGQKLVKDVTRKTMVEAFVIVDKDTDGNVKTGSVITDHQS